MHFPQSTSTGNYVPFQRQIPGRIFRKPAHPESPSHFGADQSYYQQIIDRVTSNLAGDAELAGWAMCQGKMGPAVKQRYEAMLEQDPDNARFKMLLDNWVAAKDHPTKEDLDNMAAAAKKAVLGE